MHYLQKQHYKLPSHIYDIYLNLYNDTQRDLATP